ncbi:hypothetical protein SLNWT_5192 [Streptomyces albus]|uniref:Uncharacterized protein n=1 Tax=Streptomyces albus (strain ATCC 21838 / DSM 41398 / FERM P-419 / JCM 4703 / NBRC 107858) TaxID=1081613 RepID=A0A0B5ERW4_STRA4|nr:hypothetical protein SLNWT_5192 [Streptomyces albus]AOU79872.1 hypothetical protein SLNHY_5181 [Streptomyces albus]
MPSYPAEYRDHVIRGIVAAVGIESPIAQGRTDPTGRHSWWIPVHQRSGDDHQRASRVLPVIRRHTRPLGVRELDNEVVHPTEEALGSCRSDKPVDMLNGPPACVAVTSSARKPSASANVWNVMR